MPTGFALCVVVAVTIGNATANDLDFTGCHPDTPVLILVRLQGAALNSLFLAFGPLQPARRFALGWAMK